MTTFIDQDAFMFYTPKEMHSHLLEFDNHLVRKAEQDMNIRKMVDNPFAVFSIASCFPIVHITALFRDGKWYYFVAPYGVYHRKEKHRLICKVGEDDSQGMQPWLRLEVVSDPCLASAFNQEVALTFLSQEQAEIDSEIKKFTEIFKNTEKPSVVFTAPLAMMKKNIASKFLARRFTLYQHIIGAGHEYPDDGLFYVGITTRSWKKRWAEHRAAIRRGSQRKFYKAYRERMLGKKLTYVHHKIMGVASTLEEVQNLEEAFIAAHWQDTRLLNMIHGRKPR